MCVWVAVALRSQHNYLSPIPQVSICELVLVAHIHLRLPPRWTRCTEISLLAKRQFSIISHVSLESCMHVWAHDKAYFTQSVLNSFINELSPGITLKKNEKKEKALFHVPSSLTTPLRPSDPTLVEVRAVKRLVLWKSPTAIRRASIVVKLTMLQFLFSFFLFLFSLYFIFSLFLLFFFLYFSSQLVMVRCVVCLRVRERLLPVQKCSVVSYPLWAAFVSMKCNAPLVQCIAVLRSEWPSQLARFQWHNCENCPTVWKARSQPFLGSSLSKIDPYHLNTAGVSVLNLARPDCCFMSSVRMHYVCLIDTERTKS